MNERFEILHGSIPKLQVSKSMHAQNNWYLIHTNYTQHKKKVDTLTTLIVSHTNVIDGTCHMSYEREISPL